MKRICCVFLIFCFLFCSCDVETDFVIPHETVALSRADDMEKAGIFVLINKNSGKYHLDSECVYASRMSKVNRLEIKVKNEEYLLTHGYTPCAKCSAKN